MSPVVRSLPRQGHSGPEHGTAHAGGAGVRPRGRQAGRSRRPAPGTRLSRAGLSLPVHEAPTWTHPNPEGKRRGSHTA